MTGCFEPLSIPRPNGGGASDRITVPCGKCTHCLKQKRSQWSFRLMQELKSSTSGHFITLTYSTDNLYFNDKGLSSVNKKHVQDFFKRLRHYTKNKLKYYAVSEYSPQLRPHYHIILFNYDADVNHISEAWYYGFVKVGSVTYASVNYTTKYVVTRLQSPGGRDPTFALISKGMGIDYVDTHRAWHEQTLRPYAVIEGGKKVGLPRYYKYKLYNDYERAEIAEQARSLHSQTDFQKFQEFMRKNPTSDYFSYQNQQKEYATEQFLTKIEKMNTL